MEDTAEVTQGIGAIVLLAVLQGVTEFLPVSSSGHLAIAQFFLGLREAGLTTEVALHVGTLIAVITFYRADLWSLATHVARRGDDGTRARRTVGILLAANVPAGMVGLLLKDRIAAAFGEPGFVAASFALTGGVLFLTRRVRRGQREVDLRTGLLIGLAQALAILPGFSRSGWTIAVALFLGVRPAAAARFSFLLSIPAIAGAALLQALDTGDTPVAWGSLGVGVGVAALVGLASLAWLVRLVRGMALHRFSPYLWLLAAGLGLVLWAR